jgi:dienelactone hydrolase
MRRCGLAAVVALTVLAAGCGGHRNGLRLSVTPASALVESPFTVRVTGAAASEPVTIAVFGRSRLNKVWRATLTARADVHGQVELRNRYLLALLRPLRPPAADDYLPWKQDLRIVVRSGNASGTVEAHRILQPPSVSVTDERPAEVGFYGEWLVPRGARRHTAILRLGGSEGGTPAGGSAYMLAAHGYPVLALAYFREPGLPQQLERIPLEYFRRALEWMRKQPEVDPQRIVTFGVSRGGELSLLLASTFPDLVHGAIEYVGANVVLGAIAVGQPRWRTAGQPAWTYHGKRLPLSIPVDRIDGPVFAVGGGADQLSSGQYIPLIRHDRGGHNRHDVFLLYPHAGHGVGAAVPNQPDLSETVETFYGKLNFGGTPQADEAAREDSWPRLLRFLASIR